MIRTIDHTTYNTETAELILRCDFDSYSETLYRTKKGKYFLVGEGMGPYAHNRRLRATGYHFRPHTGTIAQPSEKLIPMGDKVAKEWLEKNK